MKQLPARDARDQRPSKKQRNSLNEKRPELLSDGKADNYYGEKNKAVNYHANTKKIQEEITEV